MRKECCFRNLLFWMPDQVRHDVQKLNTFLNCDTVWKAGIQNLLVGLTGFLWMTVYEGMTGKTFRLLNYIPWGTPSICITPPETLIN